MGRLTQKFWGVLLLLLLVAALRPFPAAAETDTKFPLVIHGFLTQAFAISDGNTLLGIPNNGTTDYRIAALQFRYAISDSDNVVLQLGHQRYGESFLNNLHDDVELDWAFYQHSFSDSLWIKAGRVQIPIGIYNEIRDVGTVLPFYRPSPNVYGDDTFTSETVDGAVLSYEFTPGNSWSIDVSPYYGSWQFINSNQVTISRDRAENAFGAQFWLATPIEGLRLGIHPQRLTVRDGSLRPEPGRVDHATTWYFSADATFNRVFVRSEYRRLSFSDGLFQGFYAQAGYSFTDKIQIVLQYDSGKIRVDDPPFLQADEESDRDIAVSFKYQFLPNLLVRFEQHWNRGKRSTDPIAYLGFSYPLDTNYSILSVSASF